MIPQTSQGSNPRAETGSSTTGCDPNSFLIKKCKQKKTSSRLTCLRTYNCPLNLYAIIYLFGDIWVAQTFDKSQCGEYWGVKVCEIQSISP